MSGILNIFERYKTKLANYGQEEEFSPVFDDVELNFRMISKNRNNMFVIGNGNTNANDKDNKDDNSQAK